MAIQVYEGTFTEQTETGLDSISGVGFQPQAIILFGSDVTGDGNSVHYSCVLASTDGTTVKSTCMGLADDSATPNFAHAGFLYNRREADSTQIYRCNFSAFEADGFEVNVTIAPETGAEVHFIAFAGFDDVALLQWTTDTSTGEQNVTGVGFQPDMAFTYGVGLSTAPSAQTSAGSLGISFYDGVNQWGQCGGHIGGGGTAGTYQSDSDGLVAVKSSAILYRGAFTGMTADGFDVEWAVADGTARYCFSLCFEGGLHEVGNYQTPTSTDSTYEVTGLTLVPIGLMQASVGSDTLDTKENNTRTGIGAATGTSNRGAISGGKDGAFGDSDSAHDATATHLDLDPDTPTMDETADLVSFDATGGFTQDVSVADSDERYIGFWVMGNTAVAVNIDPSSITSAEAFGTAELVQFIDPSAIASTEAFGTAHLAQYIDTTGIASTEALGTAHLVQYIDTTAIASAEAFGTAELAHHVDGTGIASAEAFGTATIVFILEPTGIASAEVFGTAELCLCIHPTGIASAEAFGTHHFAQYLDSTSIASAEAFGTPLVCLCLHPTGIASAEAHGTPHLAQYIDFTGIASTEAFGTALIVLFIDPTGIPTAEAFGTLGTVVQGNSEILLLGVG